MSDPKCQTVAVVYMDDGPGGPCGQDWVTTSAWTKVHIFQSAVHAHEWVSKNLAPKRKRSKYVMCFMNGHDYYGHANSLEFHT